jgi:hypothetical protein
MTVGGGGDEKLSNRYEIRTRRASSGWSVGRSLHNILGKALRSRHQEVL